MLSIVIPAYDDPLRLRVVLASLAREAEHTEYEVVVVNDGGPDTLRAVAEASPRTRYAYLEPRTEEFRAGMARNLGASLTSGERILFLDADCAPCQHCLWWHDSRGGDQEVVAGRIDFIELGNLETFDGDVAKLEITHRRRDRRFYLYTDVAHYLTYCSTFETNNYRAFWTGNMSVPAATFKRLGGFWEEIKGYGNEDQELAWRMQREGCSLFVDFRAAADHIDHPHETVDNTRRDWIIRRSSREKSLVRQGRFLP